MCHVKKKKKKEHLKVAKVLADSLPQHTPKDDRISQKVLKKEKHILKQYTLLLYNRWYRV